MSWLKEFYQLVSFLRHHELSSAHFPRAVWNCLVWQGRARFGAGQIIAPWINGSLLDVRRGETGLTGNIYAGLMDYEEMGFLLHLLRQGDCFVDIGANLGAYSVLASSVKKASSIAFEPIPKAAARFRDQIRLNAIESKVSLIEKGVAAKAGMLHFTTEFDSCNRVCSAAEVERSQVFQVVSIDGEFSRDEYLHKTVDESAAIVIKIDVEGFEREVLRGAVNLLGNKKCVAIIIELNGCGRRFGVEDRDIDIAIKDFGFSLVRYNVKDRIIEPYVGNESFSGNSIYVRNLELVRERCAGELADITIHPLGGVSL